MYKGKNNSFDPKNSNLEGGREILCPFCHHTALTVH